MYSFKRFPNEKSNRKVLNRDSTTFKCNFALKQERVELDGVEVSLKFCLLLKEILQSPIIARVR